MANISSFFPAGSSGGTTNSYAALKLPGYQTIYTAPSGGVWLRTGTVLTEDGTGTATDAATYPDAVRGLGITASFSTNSNTSVGSNVSVWRAPITISVAGTPTTYPNGVIFKRANLGSRFDIFDPADGSAIATLVSCQVNGSTKDLFPLNCNDSDEFWFWEFGNGSSYATTSADGTFRRMSGTMVITAASTGTLNISSTSGTNTTTLAESSTPGGQPSGTPGNGLRSPNGTFWTLWYVSSRHRLYRTNSAYEIAPTAGSSDIIAVNWDGTYVVTTEPETINDGSVRLIRRRESDGATVDSNGNTSSVLADITIAQYTNVYDNRSTKFGNRLAYLKDAKANGLPEAFVAMEQSANYDDNANIFREVIGNGTALYAPAEDSAGASVLQAAPLYLKIN